LRTCLEQAHDDYEIVVCDNCSSPETREVVDSCSSARIRYIRSDTILSMSSNWDLAVSQARGEWVTVLGDDDGLLPHALRDLDRITQHPAPRAIPWTSAFYPWPTIALPGQGDYLPLPLGRKVRPVDARKLLAEIIAFRTAYTDSPMIYNSIIH